MNKIIIDLKRPATVDRVEIDLPAFTKFNNSYYCITGLNEGIQINAYPSINCYSISTITGREFDRAFDWDSETISREDFEKMLDVAYNRINRVLNQ